MDEKEAEACPVMGTIFLVVTTWLGSDILNRDQGQKSHEAQSTLLV